MGVRSGSKLGGARAENLGRRQELDVDFQANDGLVFCQG